MHAIPALLMTTRVLIAGACTVCLMFAALSFHAVHAQEVSFPYKGLTLNANLELAANSKIADGVILITHSGLGHYGMEVMVYLQKLLKDRGYNSLAINLSLGINNRHGTYDCAITHRHTNDDAVAEIGAWADWLKQQGVTRITLLGHSRGGAQTALYASQTKNRLIKAVVLIAPATRDNTDAATYQRNFNRPLAPVLERAQGLHKAGKDSAVLDKISLLTCGDTSATANSFLSYYAPAAQTLRVDTPALLSKIKQPILADGKRVQMKIIEGADHALRDLSADEAVDAIDAFLKNVGYAPHKS